MPKPLCFMIMPYGRKATQAEAGRGVPEIDFNALWDRAFAPTIIALGYEPVRADQDTGALIITQMIERLYFADLVLADMTIPNGNVYYEVGVRHAAKERGCVLLAADWSKRLFDVAQMRTVRYPLPEGDITEATAQAIAAAIKDPIGKLARGVSPMHRVDQGISGQCRRGGGVDHERHDAGARRVPGRNPRRARRSPRRPHGARQAAARRNTGRRRSPRRRRSRCCCS